MKWWSVGLLAVVLVHGMTAQSQAADEGPPTSPDSDQDVYDRPSAGTKPNERPAPRGGASQRDAREEWERPPGVPSRAPARAPEPSSPLRTTHLFGLKVTAAIMYGGEVPKSSFATEAGDGVAVFVGATVTPIWTQRIGFGADVDLGFKYDSTQTDSGGYSIQRFPLILSLHALVRIADGYFLTLAGGPELDAGIAIGSNGSLAEKRSTNNGSALGVMGEFGFRYVAGHPAAGIGFRYTAIHYGPPADADASNGGLVLGVLLVW